MSLREKFEQLHEGVVDELLDQLRDEPSHQVLAVAAKFLKDNGIEVAPGSTAGSGLRKLLDEMPFESEDVDDKTGT